MSQKRDASETEHHTIEAKRHFSKKSMYSSYLTITFSVHDSKNFLSSATFSNILLVASVAVKSLLGM